MSEEVMYVVTEVCKQVRQTANLRLGILDTTAHQSFFPSGLLNSCRANLIIQKREMKDEDIRLCGLQVPIFLFMVLSRRRPRHGN